MVMGVVAGLVTYGWSWLLTVNWLGLFLLTVEIRFDFFCLRWEIGLVFLGYGPPSQDIGFGLFPYGSPRAEIGVCSSLLTVPPR